MKFTTNYSPSLADFSSMKKEDLIEFNQWFMENLPYCLDELLQSVWKTPGFEDWNADFSVVSLGVLGEWLSTKIKKRELTNQEIAASEKNSPNFIYDWVFTDETKSWIVCVGTYYGQVIIKNNPSLKWRQELENKNLADYGQPIIVGKGVVPYNPIRVVNVISHGILEGTKTGKRLQETYYFR
jgi:hypothetical protein